LWKKHFWWNERIGRRAQKICVFPAAEIEISELE
jgi:hypothetical protein